MNMDSTQTVASLDATVPSATKNNGSAQVGIIKIVSEQLELFDESDHDLTYCPKGNRNDPYRGGLTQGRVSSRSKTTTSAQSSDSSHRNPSTPHRVANLAHGTNSTKTSHSPSKDNGSKGK